MSKTEIFKEVKDILCRELGIAQDEAKISLESSLKDDLLADELDVVEFIISSEEQFGIAIPDCDVENLRTVGDYVDYFEKKLSESHVG